MLKLSLGKALYAEKNGRLVLDPDLESDRMAGLSHHDRRSGTIYVLRSRSRHHALHEYRDLVKIGYTEGEMEDRIRYAEYDPAFLEGPVEAMSSTLYPRERQGADVLGFPRVPAVGPNRFGIAGDPDEQVEATLHIRWIPELEEACAQLGQRGTEVDLMRMLAAQLVDPPLQGRLRRK